MFHHVVNALPFHEGSLLYQVSDNLNTNHVVAIGTTSGVITASMATLVDPSSLLPWMQIIGLTLGTIASAVSILLAIVKWYRGDK